MGNCIRNKKLNKETNTITFAHFYTNEKVRSVMDFIAVFLFPYKMTVSSKAGITVFVGAHLMTDSTPIIFS